MLLPVDPLHFRCESTAEVDLKIFLDLMDWRLLPAPWPPNAN